MKYFVILIAFVSFFSCTQENTNVVMTYQMTQCADPWMNAEFSQNKEATLKKFLIDKSIGVLKLTITSDCSKSAVCAACICQGCDFATVEVAEADVAKMEALKFKRQ
jgi:hypothetical protein